MSSTKIGSVRLARLAPCGFGCGLKQFAVSRGLLSKLSPFPFCGQIKSYRNPHECNGKHAGKDDNGHCYDLVDGHWSPLSSILVALSSNRRSNGLWAARISLPCICPPRRSVIAG